MKCVGKVIFAIMLFNILPLWADSSLSEVRNAMTLNDCLLYAREHAFQNRLNRISVEEAKIYRRMVTGDIMPYIGLSSSGNLSFGRNIDPETNLYDHNETLYTGFGLSMSLPLFDGLVNINNLRAAKTSVLRQAERAQADEDELSMEIIKSFYNIIYCKAMVHQMQEKLLQDESDLRATIKGEELGTKSGADVAEMKALVAADEFEMTNQRNVLAIAYLQLRSQMGMQISKDSICLIESECEHEGTMVKNPRIREAELTVKEGEYNLKAAKGAFSPKISLNGGINTSYYKMMGVKGNEYVGFRKQWRDNMGEYVGITFSFPVFDGFTVLNRVKKMKIELRSRKLRLEQVRYEVDRLTTKSYIELEGAHSEFISARKRLEAEEAAYMVVRKKYELGIASVIDLYTSGAKLAAAKANLEGKRIQLKINKITFDYYSGQKLIKD